MLEANKMDKLSMNAIGQLRSKPKMTRNKKPVKRPKLAQLNLNLDRIPKTIGLIKSKILTQASIQASDFEVVSAFINMTENGVNILSTLSAK